MNRWPLNKAYFWETAPFFRILLPFAAGVLFYDRASWPAMPAFYLLVIGITFLLLTIFIYRKKNAGLYPFITFLLVNVVMFCGGISISYYSDIRNNKAWFGSSAGNSSSFLARITDAPVEKENSWKVPIAVLNAIDNRKVSPVTGNAFLYLYKDHFPMTLHKGDSIIVPGKWQPISNAGNPFEFDYAGYCRRNNLFYQQSCSVNDIRLYGSGDAGNMPFIDKAHDWCMAQLDKYISDPVTKGLIQAMLLGDEVNLDEDLRQSYSDTGIVHIIAISGGNVAIFFFAISFLLWWLKDKKHLWVKYAIALPLVWFYVVMAGSAPSAIRAALMFSLLAFSVMLQKNSNSLNQLFATAFLLLCAQPMWLFSVGFQLSFIAVLSLILFYKSVYKWVAPVNKIARLLWGAVAASISAEVLVAPLVIYYFHTFPLLFIIANVLAYLFMSVVLILGMAIILLSFIPVIAKGIGICTVWLVTVFDKIVVWLQGLNPASFHFLMLTGVELFLVYVIISGVLLFLLKKQKPALFTGLIAACLLLVFSCNDKWEQLHQRFLVVYNTGKANHIELVNGGAYAVLNTDTSARKKTEYAVKPAHTAWRAWKIDSIATSEIFEINGKRVFLLNRDINTGSKFHVDYLVINYTGQPDAVKLQQIFSPAKIIIGNNYSRKEQEKFVKASAGEGIAVHSIANDGAFVVD